MVCSMVKKGLLAAALGAGTLVLVFGTSAPSYVRTAYHKVRHNVKGAVPVQFEIDRAREQVANLGPAIHENMETLARAEEDVKGLKCEIVAFRDNLGKEQQEILVLRNGLETGDYRLAGSVSYTADEVKADLRRRLDNYEQVEQILKEKVATLKSKEKAVIAARKQLANMSAQRKTLVTKIEEIEARLRAIEADKSYNEFNFDDSALARAKESVAELDKRLNVMARVSEMEGRYSDSGVPVVVEPSRDVVKDIDAKFGAPTKGTDKSL